MSYSKKLLRNAVANWSNLAVSLIISFFLAPYILNKIGNVYFGVWALVTQITAYLWLLDFGVRESVVKYVAEYNGKQDKRMLNDIINASLKMYSIISLACILISIALSIVFPMIFSISTEAVQTAHAVTIIAGLDIAQAFVFNVFLGILMGLQRYDIFSKISILFSIIRAVLTVFFLASGYGLVAIILIQFAVNCIMNIIVYFISRKLLPFELNFWLWKELKQVYSMMISYSFFVFLNNLCQQVVFYSANFIIAIFLPVSWVTYYAIAASLIEYMKKLIWAGTQVFNPLISELDAVQESSKITSVLVQGTKYSLIIGLPFAIVYFFLGKQFIGLWMGREYSIIAGQILAVLTIMTLFSLPHYTINGILLGLNKHRIIAYCRLLESMANISLSIIFLKLYGVVGVAIGAALSHLILVVFVLPVIISKIVEISISEYVKSSYYGPLLSAVPFALSCFVVQYFYTPPSLLTFMIQIIMLLPMYGIGVWFVGLSKKERKFCKDWLISFFPASYFG